MGNLFFKGLSSPQNGIALDLFPTRFFIYIHQPFFGHIKMGKVYLLLVFNQGNHPN
jgi:hypothetical protein